MRLHPKLQRWIHAQGWASLHDAQERAVAPILAGSHDVVISAATAAGKTEAAFLPICSVLAFERDQKVRATHGDMPPELTGSGIEVLYVSPLKALINDQFNRLDVICEQVGVPVHRWHGDVPGSAKQKALKKPEGVLLITPESLEALLIHRGTSFGVFMSRLRYIVIDELHAFLSTPRGAQLQSLLNRTELAIRRRVPRIGLSATLGDMEAATRFLRPSAASDVVVICSTGGGQEMQLQIRGHITANPRTPLRPLLAPVESEADASDLGDDLAVDVTAIADHLFRTLRGADNLVFANSRSRVEMYADRLRRRSEIERVPNEFWPHHGNLAKDAREIVEEQLKDRSRPVTAICTSTLEMGIDIGSVKSVAQVGPPPSVASLRQRLGRSGRRGEPSILRVYLSEKEQTPDLHPVDQLRCDIVETVAMVRLMLSQWIEPPDDPGFNYSTLIQQIMSTIAQHGGVTAAEAHTALCGVAAFERVDKSRFVALLRAMAAKDLIMQSSDGTLLHGSEGERHVNHYSFYAAFHTPDEWRLVAGGRTLGSLPISTPIKVGEFLIFGGRRWRIVSIETEARVIDLIRAPGGLPPAFGGNRSLIGDRVREEMLMVLSESTVPPWLDRTAARLLKEGRSDWRRLLLDQHVMISRGRGTIVAPWVGDRALITASYLLAANGIPAEVWGPVLEIPDHPPVAVAAAAGSVLAGDMPNAVELALGLKNVEMDKWDWVLSEELLAEATAARMLDMPGAWRVLAMICAPAASSSSNHGISAR